MEPIPLSAVNSASSKRWPSAAVPRAGAAGGGTAEQPDPAQLVAEIERRCRRITTTTRAGRIVWRIWGSGAPVLLAHGAQGAWSHWIRNIDALAQCRTVIAVDLPGHGDSDSPPCENHRTMVMAMAMGLRQILPEGTTVDLVGFSFGSVVLAHLAARHPELTRSLVVVGAPGLGNPMAEIRQQRIRGLQGEARRAVLRANLLDLMLHHEATADDLAIHLLVANARKTRLTAEVRARLVMPDKLLNVLPSIETRFGAIWGECDRPLPHPEMQEQVLRLYHPDLDFRTIPSAGHWVMYERPEEFNAALLDMLDRQAPDETVQP